MNLTPTRKPLTFRRALLSGFSTSFLLAMLGLAALFAPAIEQGFTGPEVAPFTQGDDNLGRPNAEGSPADLVERHDCWTGEAPDDVEVPGHVIVRWDGEVSAQYRGSRAVGIALDHLFTQPDPRVAEVVAFCR